jgi:hypothetical protein
MYKFTLRFKTVQTEINGRNPTVANNVHIQFGGFGVVERSGSLLPLVTVDRAKLGRLVGLTALTSRPIRQTVYALTLGNIVKRQHMKTTLSVLFIICTTFMFGQTNYYVSPTGNNSNSGTNANPWQTIQYGLNQLSTGDTLNIQSGTYTEKVQIPTSGIYLRNSVGNSPIIDATGLTSQNSIIEISNKSNVTVEGIEMRNNIQNDAQGILIDGSGSNVTIKNCILHDIHFSSTPSAPVNAGTNAQGIIIYGTNGSSAISNVQIINNVLYDCRLGYSEGIAVNGNVDGFEVIGNTVYNLTNIGIDLIGHEGTCPTPANDQARNGVVKNNITHHCLSSYATSGGIYIDGGKNIIVENNTSYHNGYGIEIGCENIGKTTEAITVRNNIFYDNEICALALGGFAYPSGSGKVINSTFRNNTCYYNDFSNNGSGELYLSYSENTIIENNIFHTTPQDILAYAELSQPSLNFNYNVFYCQSGASNLTFDWNGNIYTGYTSFTTASSTNTNSIFNNPTFIAPSITIPDFHISSVSPCINVGNPAFIPASTEQDMDNELRVTGIVDCGADEYYPTTGVDDNLYIENIKVYPNPFSDYIIVYNTSEDAYVNIYNSKGQLVNSTKMYKTTSIKTDILESGIYFIVITANNKTTSKLVIKN